MEADISQLLQPLDATALLVLIKRTLPKVYKDQLAGVLQITILRNQGDASAKK